jgi:hypothetical protein
MKPRVSLKLKRASNINLKIDTLQQRVEQLKTATLDLATPTKVSDYWLSPEPREY